LGLPFKRCSLDQNVTADAVFRHARVTILAQRKLSYPRST